MMWQKKSSSTHLKRISRKRPKVRWKGSSMITTQIEVQMVWLQLHLHPQDFQCSNKTDRWYIQQFAGHTTCKWWKVEPKYKWKMDFIQCYNHVFCSWYYSAGGGDQSILLVLLSAHGHISRQYTWSTWWQCIWNVSLSGDYCPNETA